MKTIKAMIVLVSVLMLSGCGDQIWCGENGCGASRETATFTPL